ncbi:MAG TPA: lipid-A-disaccharide synthase [Phycisphaerae bacterium]|nr:lipid-A-disaccharide synthase [Phycisphaerae bacterium]
MEQPISTLTFFLSAAEHSGDALGAALIAVLREEFPDARFTGIGGDKMAAAGCRLLADPTRNSAMLLGAVTQVGFWMKLLDGVKRQLALDPPDVVIPIDSPSVNVRVAHLARKAGIPVCYYVAPQHWAWGSWRTGKLRGVVDTLCCVLPFEENYFRLKGIHAVYVGHPLFDQPANSPDVDPARLDPPLPTGAIKLAVLPGSRRAEVNANLPIMLEVVQAVKGRFANSVFVAAAADEDRAWQIRHFLQKTGTRMEVRIGATNAIIRWANLVLTVSGTATLEVARHHKPMVVLYALAAWKWNLVGNFLIQSRYMSLVNILADRELVPEFMPFHGSPDKLIQTTVDLLNQPQRLQEMSRSLADLTAEMEAFSRQMPASRRVALEAAKLITARNR